MNSSNVMNESMLTREIEIGSDTRSQEDFAIVVVTSKGVVHLVKTPCIVYVAAGEVTELQKGAQRLNHCIWHVSFNCW